MPKRSDNRGRDVHRSEQGEARYLSLIPKVANEEKLSNTSPIRAVVLPVSGRQYIRDGNGTLWRAETFKRRLLPNG